MVQRILRSPIRLVLVLLAPLLLSACLVTPGRFTSTLDIRADRSFAFTYQGEILASDTGKGGFDADGSLSPDAEGSDTTSPTLLRIAAQAEERFDEGADDTAEMQAIATALTKEKGFRSVRYMGDHKFEIDYAISGRLTHAFLFPFNTDAQIVLPFIAVELRGDDRVRIKAPGFANDYDKSQGPVGGDDKATKALNGSFTLTADAEIVSQNQEDGAETVPEGKRIHWTITPLTSEAPAATLRVKRVD